MHGCTRLALVALVAAQAGCDIVFSLDRPVQTTVCGDFGDPHPVRFDAELTDVTDFTFNGTYTRGFAHATVTRSDVMRTGPVPLVYNKDAERWDYDANFEANWAVLADNDRVRLARMTRTNELFVAQQLTTPAPALHVFHYAFLNSMWAPAESMEIAASTNSDAYPGGLYTSASSFDYLPIFRFDRDTQSRSVGIATRMNGSAWTDLERIGGLSSTETINQQHQPWSGALASNGDHQVLVYAATPSTDDDENADLYLSEKLSSGFIQGAPLELFNTDDEELEPWVSEDCTMITFRRTERGSEFQGESRKGGTIYQATVR